MLSPPAAMRLGGCTCAYELLWTEDWLLRMIRDRSDSNDYLVEFNGRIIGRAGTWRVRRSGFWSTGIIAAKVMRKRRSLPLLGNYLIS